MSQAQFCRLPALISLLLLLGSSILARAQSGLQVAYGFNGVQTLSYAGTMLEDLGTHPSDSFHIWHMKSTDLSGKVIGNGQYGWGEANNGRSWNVNTHTWTYMFVWGTIQVQFAQSGDALNMAVTTTNNAGSGIIFDGAAIYPLALHFPQLPLNFSNSAYNQFADNSTGPSVTVADFGVGEVLATVPGAAKPVYSGFQPSGGPNNYTALISGTSPDSLASFLPHNDRPVAPGQTDTFVASLRFAPSGTAAASLAGDVYASWAATYPPQLRWTDRRIIGTAFLASSAAGTSTNPAGYPNNPRRYFNDSNAADFDVTTAAGLRKFQARILQQAGGNVANLKRLGAQGIITWDIEGQQYPQQTSYVCSPDQIAQVAPEMESVITDSTSPYAGMKLDDAYFKTATDAGFRIGVCIRPQQFTLYPDGTAKQVFLPDALLAAQLIRKMKYAHDRWGVTLFYVDSTVHSDGGTLPAGIFQQVAAALPDSLIIPEETTPLGFAYTAPFGSFIFHTDLGTPAPVYSYYPRAFTANLVNDVDPAQLAQFTPQLTDAVRNGDILMVHADYWQANNPTVMQIYQNAGVTPVPVPAPVPPSPVPAPAPAPVPVPAPAPTPVPAPVASVTITSPSANAIVSGQIIVNGAITLPLDAAGSFLLVDGQELGTRRITGAPFLYPLDTSTLTDGKHTLQLWAHDVNNVTTLSAPLSMTVSNNAPVGPAPSPAPTPIPVPLPAPVPVPPVPAAGPVTMLTPASGVTLSGVVSVTAAINLSLDSAGSFLMVDGMEWGTQRETSGPYLYSLDTRRLTNGSHVLRIWAHDIGNATTLSTPTTVCVKN